VTDHMAMGSASSVIGMLVMGLLTSVVAPLLVVAGRRRAGRDSPLERPWAHDAAAPRRRPGLAVPVLLGFAVVHTAVVLTPADTATTAVGLHALLLAAAVVLWLPVLGRGTTRLPEAGRCAYLFLACPLLDLAGVAVVVRGDELAGIAMIVGMLPIPLAAVILTWRWITGEEREARAADAAASLPVPGSAS
jgi:cytochrome c oxidase assembly factor CtaG